MFNIELTPENIKEIEMNLFQSAKISAKEVKNIKSKSKSKSSNSRSRTTQKWQNMYKISKKCFESISELGSTNDLDLIRDACVSFRNPVVFDNNVGSARSKLPYFIPGHSDVVYKKNKGYSNESKEEITEDHLVGMSNIVLYIYINKIHERWNCSDDFIATLRSLQVLLPIPKSLNNKGSFKSWQFDVQSINECVKWYKKLQNEGITHLCSLSGELVPVMDVYTEWYESNKSFL